MRVDYNVASQGSLGEITTDIVNYLTTKGWVCRDDFAGAPVFLLHYLIRNFVTDQRYKGYKKRVLIQPIDGQKVKREFVKLINESDVVITPAKVGKRLMERSGVVRPIVVVPNYYKKEAIKVDPVERVWGFNSSLIGIKSNKYTFYHESTLTERKNVLAVVRSFLRAFSDTDNVDSVRLLIKGVQGNYAHELLHNIAREKAQYRRTPVIDTQFLFVTDDHLRLFWHHADAYVSFAHIEGFGIPLLRMAAMGKPIVTLDSKMSGYMDYLSHDSAYLVPSKLVPMGVRENLIFEQHNTRWEDVASVDQAASALLELYTNRKSPKLVNLDWLQKFEHDNVMAEYAALLQV